MTRDSEISDFLDTAGWGGARRSPVTGDASFRRYERVALDGRQAILMDAPPAAEDVRPFLAVARLLRDWGFSAPDIVAEDIRRGFLLLEDFGDASFRRVIDGDAARQASLYACAVDLLVALHRRRPPERLPAGRDERSHHLPPYDDAVLLAEARLFSDWYLPALHAGSEARDWRASLDPLWCSLFARLSNDAPVLTLRDYHADNLIWLPGRAGVARVGLLDFQDALRGHRAYDLVSLLQDARRDVPADLEGAMIDRYLAAAGAGDRSDFFRDYRILGAQRAAKIIGIFTRLSRRDGKTRYLDMIPRVWGLLERNLANRSIESLAGRLEEIVPPGLRATPPPP